MRKGLLLTLAVGILQMATGQVHWLNQIEGTATQPQPVVGKLVCGLRANMDEGLGANLINRPRASVPKELLTSLEDDREPGLSLCGVNPVVVTRPATATPVIHLRCGGSILRAHPLLVVDGEIKDSSTLSAIDPNSIASIEILKDAPAIAIYGHSGSSGVIIVTMKKIEIAPIPCAEPMEEVVIRTTACYKRNACYGVLRRVSECTIECAERTLIRVQEEARRSPSKALARVYPNPAPVGGPINWTSVQGAKELQVFTVSGQWIRSLNISGRQQGQIQLNGLPAGLYLLRFMGENSALLQTERFILQ